MRWAAAVVFPAVLLSPGCLDSGFGIFASCPSEAPYFAAAQISDYNSEGFPPDDLSVIFSHEAEERRAFVAAGAIAPGEGALQVDPSNLTGLDRRQLMCDLDRVFKSVSWGPDSWNFTVHLAQAGTVPFHFRAMLEENVTTKFASLEPSYGEPNATGLAHLTIAVADPTVTGKVVVHCGSCALPPPVSSLYFRHLSNLDVACPEDSELGPC